MPVKNEAYNEILAYIDQHPVATLGTINSDGTPQGAIVYVCADNNRAATYFITKHKTRKYQNIQDRNDVALTIVDPAQNSTLQASGHAFTVNDAPTINMVMEKITQNHVSAKEWLPPIAKLHAGVYEVVGIDLTQARLAQFEGMAIGDEHIFTKL
jgi:general stress protein 26